MKLVKYDAACRAIAEANSVDEIKDFRDKGKAIEAYAKQAKNRQMQADALEIVLRAERRLGQLLAENPKATGGQYGGKSSLDGYRKEPSNKTPTLSDMGIDKKLSARSQKMAKIKDSDFEIIIESAIEKIIAPKNVHVANNSGENEWYTPPEYIESARLVMGSIDLDPASSSIANKTIKAGKYFTKSNNGLNNIWAGNIWLNPPYAQPLINQFSDKLVAELPYIKQAIVLVNNATDTAWFQALAKRASLFCFVDKRIKFLDSKGEPSGAPLQGQSFLYIGNRCDAFICEFSKYGFVIGHEICHNS